MENPIKMDDLGGKSTIFGNTHLGMRRLGTFPLTAGHPPRLDSSPVVSDWPERDDWLRAWTGGSKRAQLVIGH